MAKIVIDHEFKSLCPPLSEEEREGLEASIRTQGNRDAIVVWPQDGKLLILDGHNRYEICEQLGMKYKTPVKVELPDRVAARLWILDAQIHKRNLTDYSKGYLIGQQYLTGGQGQGARTDLTGDTPIVKLLAEKLKITERAVRDWGLFAKAVDALALTPGLGDSVKRKILAKDVPFNRQEIQLIAALDELDRAVVWEKAKSDRSSLSKIIESLTKKKAKRTEPAKPKAEASDALKATPQLVDYIRNVASYADRLKIYAPSQPAEEKLKEYMPKALQVLLFIAEKFGHGKGVLDAYVDHRRAQDDQPEPEESESEPATPKADKAPKSEKAPKLSADERRAAAMAKAEAARAKITKAAKKTSKLVLDPAKLRSRAEANKKSRSKKADKPAPADDDEGPVIITEPIEQPRPIPEHLRRS